MSRVAARTSVAVVLVSAVAVGSFALSKQGPSTPSHVSIAHAASANPRLLTDGVYVPLPSSGGVRGETSLDVAGRIASRYHLTITSGYRSPAHNAEVGGVEGSYHTRGTPENPGAVDLVGTPADMRHALAWAQVHVANLAQGMIHSVCLARDGEPWRVSDGGLHLHLAFATSPEASAAQHPYIAIETGSGCRTAATRFAFALEAIEGLRTAGSLGDDEARQARLHATALALRGTYGVLDDATHATVVSVRRAVQAALDQTARPTADFTDYVDEMDKLTADQEAGNLTIGEADAKRSTTIAQALAGTYGKLTAAERRRVLADRDRLGASTAPGGTTTTPTTPGASTQTVPATPTTSTPAPAGPAAPPVPAAPAGQQPTASQQAPGITSTTP